MQRGIGEGDRVSVSTVTTGGKTVTGRVYSSNPNTKSFIVNVDKGQGIGFSRVVVEPGEKIRKIR